jgi:hypothetical protein
MATRKQVLRFSTTDAPPELDFLFALVRGTRIPVTLQKAGVEKKLELNIDGILIFHGNREKWEIFGRFQGDGKTSWSNFEYGKNEEESERYIFELWSEFRWFYDKRTRKGALETCNFKRRIIKTL